MYYTSCPGAHTVQLHGSQASLLTVHYSLRVEAGPRILNEFEVKVQP